MEYISTTYSYDADDNLDLNLRLCYMVEDFIELIRQDNTDDRNSSEK